MIKKLTTLFFFSFFVVSLFAQLPEAIRGKQSVIAKDYNLNAANILTVPNDTSALAATNSIAIKNGVFYIKKTYWEQVNGSFQLSSGQKVYLVEDSTNTQPGSTPSDSSYYLLGGAPSGAQWSSFTAHRIALYTTSGGWEQIPGVVNDYAITLDDNIYHQYNGSTWPVASAISVLLNGNIGPMRVGTINPTRIRLMTNNVDRIKIDANGDATFLKLSGTNKGIAQFDATGMLLRTEPAASSDTTTNKPLGIASDGTLKRMSYWPGSGSGGASGLQANITADPALTVDNTITFTGKSLDFSGDRSTWNLNDSGRIATANDFGIYSLGYGRWLASTLYLKSSTASFGSNLKSIFHYETGTGDSVAIEAKADGLRITTLPTSITGSIVRRNTNGFLVQGSTIALGSEVAGTLTEGFGGTNQTAYTTGDILYATGSNTLGKRSIGSSNQVLTVVGGVPTWATSPNYWNRQQYGALASTNIIQPATLADTVVIGPTATVTALSALFNVGGTSRFWGRTSINSALNANYQLAIDGGSGTGRALIVSGQTRIDERLAVNTSADPATGIALGVTGSSVAAIYSLSTTGASGSTMVHNQFIVGNQSGAATNSHTAIYANVNNNSDASSVQTAALYRGINIQIQTKSNSTTPVTVGTGIDFELGNVNARTQTFTTVNGFWAKPIATTTQLITTGGNYYSFLADSSLAATYTGSSAWGFYQRNNTAKTIKNKLEGNTLVGAGTQNASAAFEVLSTTQGLLLPRMTKTQRDAIASPAAGLAIYQTDNTPGLRVYNGTNWIKYSESTD